MEPTPRVVQLPSRHAALAFVDETLQLIEESAPLDRFREARATLRRSLDGPDALARADEAYERAVRIREALSEHRRREIELGALIDTAADLSALHEPEAVLAAICRRVRSLLGADAAWITLVDPERGDTYHCMTDGILDDAFVRKLRLSEGTGLGGLVLETGRAEWTDDYLADDRFTHTPSIDRSARDEGLIAMLGAPMKRGDELLGIVIAGNRGHRRFATQDVTLLQTLADHAAIAIANARLVTSSMKASAELREANETIRRNAEAVERSAQLHTRLSQLVLEGIELQELLAPVAELLGGRVVVIEADHRILAVAGAVADGADHAATPERGFLAADALPDAIAAALAHVLQDGQAVAVPATGEHLPRLLAPMLARREPLGALLLTKASVQEGDLRLLESAALPLALFLSNARAQADAERVVRGELLDDLISDKPPSAEALARRAQRIGWDVDGEYVVVVVDRGGADSRWMQMSGSRLAAQRRGLMTERDGALVLLLPGDSADVIADHVSRALRARDTALPTIAAARPAAGVGRIPAAYAEAQQALALALALDRPGTITLADRADGYGIIFGSTRPQELDAFIDRTLGPLIEHDRERGSELLTTLETWFEHDGHLANTAAAAHIHVNTLYKRLERLDELLGEGWRKSDERLQIQLALRLRRLAAALGGVRGPVA